MSHLPARALLRDAKENGMLSQPSSVQASGQTKVTDVGALTVPSPRGKDPPWRMDTAYTRVQGRTGVRLVRENVPAACSTSPRKEWAAVTSYVHSHRFPPFPCLLLFSRPASLGNTLDPSPSPKPPTPIHSGLFSEQS